MEAASPRTAAAVTVTEEDRREAGNTINRILVLKLRAKQKKITWTEDTVDNEHLNRKSSKSKIGLTRAMVGF